MQMTGTMRKMMLGLATFLAGAALAPAQIPEKEKSGRFTLEWRRDLDFRPHYYRSTASFEYATRLDHEMTNNDWDLALRGSGTERRPYLLGVNTVTDDRSRIWNIGRVALKSVSKKSVRARGVIEAKPDRCGQVRGLAPPAHKRHSWLLHSHTLREWSSQANPTRPSQT